jgi:hypothetical protein
VEKRAVEKLRKKFAEEISPQMTGRILNNCSSESALGAGDLGFPFKSRIFHGAPPLRICTRQRVPALDTDCLGDVTKNP